jgi:hypothetical protein
MPSVHFAATMHGARDGTGLALAMDDGDTDLFHEYSVGHRDSIDDEGALI